VAQWVVAQCVVAQWAAVQRAVQQRPAAPRAVARQAVTHGTDAIAPIMYILDRSGNRCLPKGKVKLCDTDRRDAVTQTDSQSLNTILRSVRHSALTREQVFRLWRCAVKDDDKLIDEVIQQIYESIVAFDCKRAESVIELMVRRNATAGPAFHSLLQDMHAVGPRRALHAASPAWPAFERPRGMQP
jgi:hypothetical protein